MSIFDFICWVAVISLVAAFLLSLAVKWGWLEYLQVHAPNDLIHQMLTCKFCTSFWICMAICLILSIATGHWVLMVAPMCSTIITRELW